MHSRSLVQRHNFNAVDCDTTNSFKPFSTKKRTLQLPPAYSASDQKFIQQFVHSLPPLPTALVASLPGVSTPIILLAPSATPGGLESDSYTHDEAHSVLFSSVSQKLRNTLSTLLTANIKTHSISRLNRDHPHKRYIRRAIRMLSKQDKEKKRKVRFDMRHQPPTPSPTKPTSKSTTEDGPEEVPPLSRILSDLAISDTRDRTHWMHNTGDNRVATWTTPQTCTQLIDPVCYHKDTKFTVKTPHGRVSDKSTSDSFTAALNAHDEHPCPPVYVPVILRGASGEPIKCQAFLDTGAEESFLHPDLVKYMTNTATLTNVRYGTADAAQPSIRLTLTDEPVRIWCGSTSTEMHFGVLDLGRDECPYILIGRRLMAVLGIHLSNVPYAYPLRDVYDDKEFVDINDMESKRLTDTHALSPEETVRRDEVRNHIKYLLQLHTQTVRVDSFINHPDAMVRILHDIGTLPSYVNQRLKPTKSMLDSYITDQVLMWVDHGKLIKWDRKIHGEWPRYNMPLLPVVTHGPNSQVLKVRVCVDARGVNMGIVNDDTPIPNIQTLYAGLQNKKYFAEFDMVSAFNQFPVHPDEQHKLHITWEGQHYVFAGAPFGVKHLSSHVQRVLSSIFADMPYVTIYVDNLIVASDTLADHNAHCENFMHDATL